MPLNAEERKVRKLLIRVAKGGDVALRRGRISYKEVWTHIRPDEEWYQARTSNVVDWIVRVAVHEIQNNRPPLNVIVTRTNQLIPTQKWAPSKDGLRRWLEDKSGCLIPYQNYEDAQKACWSFWSNHLDNNSFENEINNTDEAAEEGLREDKQAAFIKRNHTIIEKAKKRDHFICQACGFSLAIADRHIIDCHHKVPLSHSPNGRITKLSDLVCLCPTCHRIAHAEPYPLSIERIREYLELRLRGWSGNDAL